MTPKIAMFVPPHTGGIFTFYRRMSKALGRSVCSVELSTDAPKWRDYAPELAGAEHEIIDLEDRDGKAASQYIVDWVLSKNINTIILTPLSSAEVFDALAHMPPQIRVLVRLTEISDYGYKMALRRADYIDGIIVQCPRQEQDIAELAPNCPRLLLPNGVDTEAFAAGTDVYTPPNPLRLLVVDRLVDLHKRILLLPKFCALLEKGNVNYELTIAGDGPDAEALRNGLERNGKKANINMLGRVGPKDVQRLMSEYHVYLKLSLNEGSPNGVLEAMSAGLATIAMQIPGVMDFVIADGESGVLVQSQKIEDMAHETGLLAGDPNRLAQLRIAARASIVSDFSMGVFERRLKSLLLEHKHIHKREPISWDSWSASLSTKKSSLKKLTRIIPLKWRVYIRENYLCSRRSK